MIIPIVVKKYILKFVIAEYYNPVNLRYQGGVFQGIIGHILDCRQQGRLE